MSRENTGTLFPTAPRTHIIADFDTRAGAPELGATRIKLPEQLSSRIQNEGLLNSLKRDTSLDLSSMSARRKRAPPLTATGSSPRFTALPSLTRRNRPGIELSRVTQRALDNPDDMPSDIEMVRVIVSELRIQRDHVGDTGDYREAEKYQQTLLKAERKLHYMETHEGEEQAVQDMMTRHAELEAIVTHHQEQWDKDFEAWRAKSEESGNALVSEHADRLQQFDDQQPTEIDPQFQRRSPRLLALRSKEARLALTKQFAAADKMKRQGDKEEERESQDAMEKTYNKWLLARERLVHEQESKVAAFVSHAEASRKIFVLRRDKKLCGYLRRMGSLDKSIKNTCRTLRVKEEDIGKPIHRDRMDFVLGEEGMSPKAPAEKRGKSAPRRARQWDDEAA